MLYCGVLWCVCGYFWLSLYDLACVWLGAKVFGVVLCGVACYGNAGGIHSECVNV